MNNINWGETKKALSDYVKLPATPNKGKVWFKESKDKEGKITLKKVEMSVGRQIRAFFNPSPYKLTNVAKTIAKMPPEELDNDSRKVITQLAGKLQKQAMRLQNRGAYKQSQEVMEQRTELLKVLSKKSTAPEEVKGQPPPKIEEKPATKEEKEPSETSKESTEPKQVKAQGAQEGVPKILTEDEVRKELDTVVAELKTKLEAKLEAKNPIFTLAENPRFRDRPADTHGPPHDGQHEQPLLTLSIGACTITLNWDIRNFETDVMVNASKPSMLGGAGIDEAIHSRGGTCLLKACKLFPEINNKGERQKDGDAKMTPGTGQLFAAVVIHAAGPCCPAGLSPERKIEVVDGLAPTLKQTYDTALQNAQTYIDTRKNGKYPGPELWPYDTNSKDEQIPIRNLTYTEENWKDRITSDLSLPPKDSKPSDALDKESEKSPIPPSDALDAKIRTDQPISIALPAISQGIFGFTPERGMPIALLSVLEYIKKYDGDPPIKHFHFALFDKKIHEIGKNEITAIAEKLGALPAKQE